MAKKKKNDEFIEGKKFEFDGVWGADTPADWSDVIDDGKWETVPRNQPGYVDPKMLAEMQRIEIMMANAMALEAGKGTDGVGIVDVGLTGVYGAENMSAGDVFLPKKTDLVDMEEVAVHYGEWGSAISDMNGRIFETAAEIMKAWGVQGWEKCRDSKKMSMEFMMDLRDWFIVKYMPMLQACATPTMYAEFKGVGLKAMMSRIYYQELKLLRDGDDRSIEWWNGEGSVRKTRPRMDAMQFVNISGVRFVLVPLEELQEWYLFLARKGMGKLVTEARFGEARYLGRKLVTNGAMGQEEASAVLAETDSVQMWLRSERMSPVGGDKAHGDSRKWGGDGRQQSYTDEAWEEYERWAKKRGFAVVRFRLFTKRVYALGYTRFAKGGRRGFYWWVAADAK